MKSPIEFSTENSGDTLTITMSANKDALLENRSAIKTLFSTLLDRAIGIDPIAEIMQEFKSIQEVAS